jgi:hypothetical protein
VALEVSLQIQYKNETNPIGNTNANIYEDVDILSSLQRLDSKDQCSMILPDREVDLESEQSLGNEASTIAVMSRKLRTLGSTIWQQRGTQLGRLGGEARAIASV